MAFVLSHLKNEGYCEATIGVESNNDRALGMYQKFGFTQFMGRKRGKHQGERFEYEFWMKTL